MTDQKKTRGLTAAPNAAARMQALIQESAAPQAERDTQISNALSKEVSTRTSNPLLDPVMDGVGKEGSEDTSNGVRTHERKEANSDASAAVNRSGRKTIAKPAAQEGGLHQRVRDKLSPKETREGTVRLSIDVSESMHEKIKRYCLANRLPSTRALVVLLLDDLLSDAGY